MDNNFSKYPNYKFIKEKLNEQRFYCPINYMQNNSIQIQVQQIIAESCCSHVLEFELPFPDRYPAIEIIDSTTDVKILSRNILKDIVVINANLHKRFSYMCFEEKYDFPYRNVKRESIVGNQKIICTDIPFECSLKMSDIKVGDNIEIGYAGVKSPELIDILEDSFLIENVTAYKVLKEKLIININVTAERMVRMKI